MTRSKVQVQRGVNTIADLPDLRAAEDPGGACIADATVSLTNAEFAARVRSTETVLRRSGIAHGHVVAIALPNRIELIIALFAIWRLGAVATPVNPALTRPRWLTSSTMLGPIC